MSYLNFNTNLPGVGSNTNSYSYTTSYTTSSPGKIGTSIIGGNPNSYSYTTTNYSTSSPSTNKVSYSDPFAKPSTVGYGVNTTTSYTTPAFGNVPSTSTYGNYSYGGNTSNTYTTPTYGATSISSTTPSSGYGTNSFGSPSTYNYSNTSFAAPQNKVVPPATSYSNTSTYGLPSASLGVFGASVATTQPSVSVSVPKPSSFTTSNCSANQQPGAHCSSVADTSKYEALMRQLKSSGQKFKDPEFPPELRSLTGGLSAQELAEGGNPLDWNSIIWLRADEIYGKGNYKIFQGEIEPDDIQQRALGDCYFLSTIASIAEKPDRIKKLFVTDVPNEQGCYAIRVCDGGIWQTVILDDYFPCSSKSREPIFTVSNGGELWVLLLEKAWAKIYGSYARIEAGLTKECLHDLTGAPTKVYLPDENDTKKSEEIWKDLMIGEERNYIMTCGAGDFFDGADLMTDIGLVASHAYSLLATYELTDRYGKKVRLVKLRNPWGQGEWKGDWSDESPLWTPELKRQVGLTDRDDGDFHMSFDDVVKYFSDIQVCKVHDDFRYNAVKANSNAKNGCYFKVTVKVPGHYFLTINQESSRKHAVSEEYQYSDVYLLFGKKNGNGYDYVEGINKADKEVWTDGHIEAGEYLVFAKVAWNDKRPKDFSLSCYGQGDVDIQALDHHVHDFVEKAYTSKGRQSKKFDDYKHCGVSNCFRAIELTDDGFGYIYYKNQSNKTLEEEIEFTVLEGLKLKKPYRGNSFKVSVPPNSEKAVITKVIPGAPRIRQAFRERSRFV